MTTLITLQQDLFFQYQELYTFSLRLIILIFNTAFGIYIIYKSKKTRAKLLFPLGMLVFLIGLWYLIYILSYSPLSYIIFTIPFVYWQIYSGIICAFIIVLGFYLSVKLLIPEKRRYRILAVILIIILSSVIEIINLIFYTNYIFKTYALPHSQFMYYLIDFLILSFMFLTFFSLSLLGFGFLFKCIKTKGLLRKKYLYLSIGFLLYSIFMFIDWITQIANWFFEINIPNWEFLYSLISLTTLITSILSYLGLREEPEIKIPIKKEIKVEGDLFRLYQIIPGEITEEAVTYYKEQEVCLVCKGKVETFSFICPNCRALYCEKCVRSLTNLENACWVCSDPFDKTKPSKPFKEEKEDIKFK